LSAPERIQSFVPLESVPLPRPLQRFGGAFPTLLAETYANAYTSPGAVIVDPLARPCSAADAVEGADRRGAGRSQQPLGEWARRAVLAAPPADELIAAFEAVAQSALAGVGHRVAMRELYASRCATCRGPVVVEAYLWERDAPTPSKKAFRCAICAREGRALLIEAVSEEDLARSRAIEAKGISFWQFVERFGSDTVAQGLGATIASLFTPRNLAAIMGTLRAVETSGREGPLRDLLKLALLEVVVAGSCLNALAGHATALRIEKGRARRGHASQFREINVWLEYERTVRDLAAWLPTRPRRTRQVQPADAPAELALFEAPADDGLGAWTYVASVLFLGAKAARPLDAGDGRLAARERLLRLSRHAFLDAHRSSRPDAPAVVYLPRAEAATVAAVALAGAGVGYRLRGILYQEDALPSAYGGAAAVLDFDREVPLLKDQAPADAVGIEETIRQGVHDAIAARGRPISTELAAAAALEALAKRRLLAPLALARAGGVSELELFLDHFKSALADGKRSGIERIAKGEDAEYALITTQPDQSPLEDRVEWGVWTLLSAARDVDTRTLLRRAYGLFRGFETPDRELVQRCLSSYGAQGEDGRWRLREEDGLVLRQAEQTALAASLADAGHRLGFKVRFGREVRRRPLSGPLASRGSILADLLNDADRLAPLTRSVRAGSDALDLVDVVWYDRARMTFLWQLDWTARAHRSVVALGEAIPDDDRVFRFYAVADARQALLAWKLGRLPEVAEAVRKRGWRLVKWEPLRRFATDPAASLADLEQVLGLEPGVEQPVQQLVFQW
jgi:hypothetical protein